MAYMNYQNKRVYYEVIGKGENIVLLHGNTGSSKMFESIIPILKERY